MRSGDQPRARRSMPTAKGCQTRARKRHGTVTRVHRRIPRPSGYALRLGSALAPGWTTAGVDTATVRAQPRAPHGSAACAPHGSAACAPHGSAACAPHDADCESSSSGVGASGKSSSARPPRRRGSPRSRRSRSCGRRRSAGRAVLQVVRLAGRPADHERCDGGLAGAGHRPGKRPFRRDRRPAAEVRGDPCPREAEIRPAVGAVRADGRRPSLRSTSRKPRSTLACTPASGGSIPRTDMT